MKFGYDVDGVITDAPEYYSVVFKALRAADHKVILVTDYDEHFRDQRVKELQLLDIEYDELIITDQKEQFCKEEGITWFVDDHPRDYFPNGEVIDLGLIKVT